MFRGPGFPITSVGLLNALGRTRDEVIGKLMSGHSGLRRASPFQERATRQVAWSVGQVENDTDANTNSLPRQTRLVLSGLSEVKASALAACKRWGADRVAVLLGTSTSGIEASERAFWHRQQTGQLPHDYSMEKQHSPDAAMHDIQRAIGSTGPAYVISTACSSSAKALAAAGRLLATGLADAVLVAGVDSLCLTTLLGFESLGVMDSEPCRPFAEDRKGLNIGEGAAFLLLEREADSGVLLLSAGETHDAHHMTHPHPEGLGAEQAMKDALLYAGIEASAVGYINAHGTGTVANDEVEAQAIKRVFGRGPPLSSTKGSTGHLLGACGATEAAFCHAALLQQCLPGNGKWAPSRELGLRVVRETTASQIEYALSNSFAFGGSNASLLLASAQAQQHATVQATAAPSAIFELVQLVAPLSESALSDGNLLDPRVLGRASSLTRLFAETMSRLLRGGFDATLDGVVFASAYGEMETTLKLLELQTTSTKSSPLRFQVSVHNAAQGLLSIATGLRGFATSLAAGSNTFAMSLMEAMAYLLNSGKRDVAVLVADEAAPAPLGEKTYAPIAIGLHLRRHEAATCPGAFVSPPYHGRPHGEELMCPPAQSLRENPTSDALAFAQLVQQGRSGTMALGARARLTEPAGEATWWLDLDVKGVG